MPMGRNLLSAINPNSHILLMPIYLGMHLIAIAWSPEPAEGLSKVFLKSPLALLPLSILVIRPQQYHMYRVRWAFILCTIITSLTLLVRAVAHWSSGSGWPVYLDFSPYVHPAYLGMAVGTALLLLIGSEWRTSKGMIASKGLSIIVLASCLMALSSKAQILSVLVVVFGWAILAFVSRMGLAKAVVPLAVVLMAVVPLGFHWLLDNARIRHGVNELHNLNLNDPDENSTGTRVILWRESLQLALDQPWGYGTGHGKSTLVAQLESHGHGAMAEKGLNSHNQYLGDVLSIGVQGCVVLILMLLLPALSVRQGSIPGTLPVIALLSMSMFTESVLERQTGVALVALMLTLLTYRPADVQS